ncbi:ATP-dependent zinc protease [Nisaea sp.]|uniref:ATP-dependent zinc protease family protein n=1 Tax=Nisaea sp. TaxID=2024842 RepID=UPI002B27A3E1|nr:RimK/LysX family protein [Nisaea sp.]
MKRHKEVRLPVIGWREWVSLGELGIERIKTKIDTGARTSSLHAFNIRQFTDHGAPHVAFVVHPRQRYRLPVVECIAEVLDEREVMSSSGHKDVRYVISTDVSLAGFTWPIEITLADRDQLGFRMLLGRQAVRDRFLVDPGRSFVTGRKHVVG